MFSSILRRLPAVAVVVVSLLRPDPAGRLLAQSTAKAPDHPEITQLRITGVKSLDAGLLQSSLSLGVSHCRSLVLKPICLVSKSPTFYQRAYLDHQELARDVLRARVFYYERGFRNTTVDTTVTRAGRNQVHVTFAVHEGPPTIVTALTVAQRESVLTTKQIDNHLLLKRGEPLSLVALDSTRALLQAQLWDEGHSDAVIDTSTTVDTAAHTGSVAFTIDPRWVSRVASVDVQGNTRVDDRTVKKGLYFKEGDVYRRSDVLKSQRSLYESNLFRRASIEMPEADDSLKHVLVVVQEAPPRVSRVSAGFNTVDFVEVQGHYDDYNWRGGAKRLSLDATLGNLLARQLNGNGIFYDVGKAVVGGSQAKYFAPTYTGSAELRYPSFGSVRNTAALGAFVHRRSAPGIYVDRGFGASATFTRTIGERSPASINYRFEVTRVDAGDVYFCVNYGVCDQPTLIALRANQRLSPLSLTSQIDKTDDPFEPRRGYRTIVDLEHASSFTFSDFRYNRASGDFATFHPFGKRATLGGHVQLGYVAALSSTLEAVGLGGSGSTDLNILHPRKRFYAGGANSVRGYGEAQLGPRVLTIPAAKLLADSLNPNCTAATITRCNPDAAALRDRDFEPRPLGGNELVEANVEFRFPLFFQSLIGATFVDGAWLAQNINPSLPRSKAAITPGFGVRYLSPVGPIRVDLGINPLTREKLPVVTEDVANGGSGLVRLQALRTYSPSQGNGGLNNLLSRLTLHLSIGEAF